MTPGVRSARWLVTTKPIWPWVSTAALERPVVPEVKKNQQGSSCSTATFATLAPACDAMASATERSPNGALAVDAPGELQRTALHGRGVLGKIDVAQERLRAGGLREIGDLIRHQAEIGGHPDRTEPERGEHREEHLVAVLGMDEDAVALGDAARGECSGQRRDLRIDLAPGPGFVTPDETGTRPMPPRILGQHVSEIHDAAGHAQGLHRASSSTADGARAARSLQPIYRHRMPV